MSGDNSQMQVWAIPLGFQVFGQEIGDHTWVSSDNGYCEGCRFGTVPTPDPFYCSTGRWQGGHYTPPSTDSRKLAQGDASRDIATCIAGTPYRFMGIPSQSGIVYAVNGVCHNLTNRILYPSNLTAEGAKGYGFIKEVFGVYGTLVPMRFIPPLIPIPFFPFVIANPLFAVAVAVQIGVLIEWGQIRGRCVPASADIAPSSDSAHDRYLAEVRQLHTAPLLEQEIPDWTPAAFSQLIDKQYQRHMAELDLTISYRGAGIPEAKLSKLRDIWSAFHKPDQDWIEAAFAGQPSLRLDAQSKVEMSRDDALIVSQMMNMQAADLLREVVGVLGPEDFTTYYGASPDEAYLLIDPQILGG